MANDSKSTARVRQIAIHSLATDEAVTLAIEADQAAQNIDRAVARGTLSHRDARQWRDKLDDFVERIRNEFRAELHKPLRDYANRTRRRNRRAQGAEQPVQQGQVQSDAEDGETGADDSAAEAAAATAAKAASASSSKTSAQSKKKAQAKSQRASTSGQGQGNGDGADEQSEQALTDDPLTDAAASS